MRCSIVRGCKDVGLDLFFYSLKSPCIQKSTGCALAKRVSQSDGIRVSIDHGRGSALFSRPSESRTKFLGGDREYAARWSSIRNFYRAWCVEGETPGEALGTENVRHLALKARQNPFHTHRTPFDRR